MFHFRNDKPAPTAVHTCSVRTSRNLLLLLVLATINSGCAYFDGRSKSAEVAEIHPGILQGYLSSQELPTSLALLPSPPAKGSAALALDEEVARNNVALRDTPRWEQATSDADLSFPTAAAVFSCALEAPITEQDTPQLYLLLRRSLADAGLSTYTAKNNYQRQRPFTVNKEPICTPHEQEVLAKDGSYPSGHTAIGWAWALILTEVSPAQADAILARGLAYGESRNVCNVHWHSDVVQGRVMGAATVARLHDNPTFQADLKAAKAELEAVRKAGLKPGRDCAAEARALAH